MSLFKAALSAVSALFICVALASMAMGQDEVRPSPIGLSLTVGVKRTDNRDAIPDGYIVKDVPLDKEEDTEMWFTPTISFFHELEGKYRMRLSYSPSYTYYDNPREGGTDNELSHAVRADLDLYIGGRTEVKISENYWWSGAKDWHYGEDYVFAPDELETRNDDYYKNDFVVAVKRTLTADDYLRISGKYNIKRYDEEELALYSDEDEYVFHAELMRRQSRYLSYGLYTEYTAFDRNNGDSADPMGGEETVGIVDVGIQYINSGIQIAYDLFGNQQFIFSARTGYNFMWYEADGIDDDSMLGDSVLELLLYQQARTSGRIGMKYGKAYADIFPYSSQKNTTLFASVSRILGKRNKLRLGATLEYRTRTYELADVDPDAENYDFYQDRLAQMREEGDDGKRDSTGVRLNASYKWTSNFSTSVFYSYENVDSDVDSSYTENTIGVNATLKFL